MPKIPLPTELPKERAFLVGVELAEDRSLMPLGDSLQELALLADTAGLVVVGQATQRLRRPDPSTYIRSGKVEEIRGLASEEVANIILFDDELSPRHQRELEKRFGDSMRVVDRTELILDIFAQHARTREGALQVELAQYEYRLPRLTRAWTHLVRQAGGGGGRAGRSDGVGLRGPGEMQLEVDRREIGKRMAYLRQQLEKVRAHRKRHRVRRRQAQIPIVALIGYTNAGKSTLLNRLSGSNVLVADKLFATLDPTTRRIALPGGRQVLMTDTVGFIQKLPTMLVAAFRATLEEIADADLLLHVVDITHPNAEAQAQAVSMTLDQIEARGLPIVTALNKIDMLGNGGLAAELAEGFPCAVPVSALRGEGMDALLEALEHELFEQMSPIQALLPYKAGGLLSLFHEHGVVERTQHRKDGIWIEGRLPNRYMVHFRPYAAGSTETLDLAPTQ